jgi:hypothetical protein
VLSLAFVLSLGVERCEAQSFEEVCSGLPAPVLDANVSSHIHSDDRWLNTDGRLVAHVMSRTPHSAHSSLLGDGPPRSPAGQGLISQQQRGVHNFTEGV